MKYNSNEWFLIENEDEYRKAMQRYQEVKYARKNSIVHKEKQLLIKLISEYEEKNGLCRIPPENLIQEYALHS